MRKHNRDRQTTAIRFHLLRSFLSEMRVEAMDGGGWKVIFPIVDHIGDCQTLYLTRPAQTWRVTDSGWLASECEMTEYTVPQQVMESLLAVYDFRQTPDGEIYAETLRSLKEVFWAVTNYSTLASVVSWMRSYRMITTEERGSL